MKRVAKNTNKLSKNIKNDRKHNIKITKNYENITKNE